MPARGHAGPEGTAGLRKALLPFYKLHPSSIGVRCFCRIEASLQALSQFRRAAPDTGHTAVGRIVHQITRLAVATMIEYYSTAVPEHDTIRSKTINP